MHYQVSNKLFSYSDFNAGKMLYSHAFTQILYLSSKEVAIWRFYHIFFWNLIVSVTLSLILELHERHDKDSIIYRRKVVAKYNVAETGYFPLLYIIAISGK